MFKKTERLTTGEFQQYFKTGRRHHTPYFTIITTKAPFKKCAVVVGKKVSKSAVGRNLLRRRIYAQLRATLPTDFTGVVLVVVKPALAKLTKKQSLSEIQHMIAELMKSA